MGSALVDLLNPCLEYQCFWVVIEFPQTLEKSDQWLQHDLSII